MHPRSQGGIARIFGDGLREPGDMVAVGGALWVANGYSVSEFSAATGAETRVVDLAQQCQAPVTWCLGGGYAGVIAADGKHLWAAGRFGQSLYELSESSGAQLATVHLPDQGGCCENGFISSVTSDGSNVWVVNPGLTELTELSTTTGHVVRTVTSLDGLLEPTGPAAAVSGVIWVIEQNGVQEFSATSGALLATVAITGASGVAFGGGHVWVSAGSDMVELSQQTAARVRTIRLTHDLLGGTSGIALVGGNVWALYNHGPVAYWSTAWGGGSGLVEVDASTGAILRNVVSPQFADDAQAVVGGGGRVWVLDPAVPGSLIALSSASAAVITPATAHYDFNSPAVVVADAKHVWVANATQGTYPDAPDGSIAELMRSTGRQLAVLSGLNGELEVPHQAIDNGHDVWVLGLPFGVPPNGPTSHGSQVITVTEIDASTGAYVRTLAMSDGDGPYPRFANPSFTLSDGRLFVNNAPSSLNEYSATTGRHLQDLGAAKIGLPGGILGLTSDGNDVWVAGEDRLTELSAATGRVLRTFVGASYNFSSVDQLQRFTAGGGHLWVEMTVENAQHEDVDVLAEYAETTGQQLRVLSAAQDLGLLGVWSMNQFAGNLWLTGSLAAGGTGAVMELSATTGAIERTFSGAAYDFDLGLNNGDTGFDGPTPSSVAVVGSDAWASEPGSVTEWRF